MQTKIGGVLETEIYSIDDGFVAIEAAVPGVALCNRATVRCRYSLNGAFSR